MTFSASPNVVGDGDLYEVDVDGDGVMDIDYTAVAGDTFDDVIAGLVADYAGNEVANVLLSVNTGGGADDDQLIITNLNNVASALPTTQITEDPDFYEVVGTAASIPVTVSGTVGVGDTYSVQIDWTDADGLPQSVTVTTAPVLLGSQGTTVIQWEAIADELAGLINGNAALTAAGITATDAGVDGILTVISAPTTSNPIGEITVQASGTDGAGADIPAVPTVILINTSGTLEAGDIARVDLNNDGIYEVVHEVQPGEAGNETAIFTSLAAAIEAYDILDAVNDYEVALLGGQLQLTVNDGSNPTINLDFLNYPGELDVDTYTINAPVSSGASYTLDLDAAPGGVGHIIAETYIAQVGDTAADVAAGLYNQLDSNTDGFLDASTGYQISLSGSTITITGDTPGVNDVNMVLFSGTIDGDTGETWSIDYANLSADEQLEVTITLTGGLAQTFNIPWNGNVLQTLTDLGDAITTFVNTNNANAVVVFSVDDITQTLSLRIDDPDAGDVIDTITAADITIIGPAGNGGTGQADVAAPTFADDTPNPAASVTITDTAPTAASANDTQDLFETSRVIGSEEIDEPVQEIDPTSETDGVDSTNATDSSDVVWVNEIAFTFEGSDTFVAQAVDMSTGGSNWLDFQASGFDNDDIPYDFREILSDAGYAPAAIGNDGADGGVKNVAYVGDWQPNIDWLAFQNADGTMAASGGNALNYLELQGMAATRDDADATAAALFDGAANLTYVVLGNDTLGQDNYLRIYYNEPGTDHAPEAVIDLVGFNNINEVDFNDIVNVSQSQLIANNAGVNDINDYFVG